jgi:hypothetical protein
MILKAVPNGAAFEFYTFCHFDPDGLSGEKSFACYN